MLMGRCLEFVAKIERIKADAALNELTELSAIRIRLIKFIHWCRALLCD